MTPLIKSLVSLTEEASEYIWFDMDYLPRYSINWKNINSVNMPFDKTAICGRDKFGDRFLVLVDQIDDTMMLVSAWARNEISLYKLVRQEPDWAMSRVQVSREQAEEIEGLKLEVSAQMDKVDELWQQKFWFARDLMEPLDYARWENFVTAINRAIESCKTTGYDAEDHFRGVTKMIELAKGAKRQVDDFMLTRYACYLERAEGTLAIVHRANEYLLKFIGERNAEIERLKQRCTMLEDVIDKQGKRAITAIDNAKATASHMLKLAEEKEKALNPALLESEREANAKLTARVEELEQALKLASGFVEAYGQDETKQVVRKALGGKQ